MSLRPVNFEAGRLVILPAANSVTFVKGDACVSDSAGLMTQASSSTAVEVHYIVQETVTTTAANQLVEFYKVGPSVRINADCDGVVSTVDQGTFCDLASATQLNPDASTNDLFLIEKADTSGGNGAVETTTVVFGYFVNAVPNS